jgi:hypothetical protein
LKAFDEPENATVGGRTQLNKTSCKPSRAYGNFQESAGGVFGTNTEASLSVEPVKKLIDFFARLEAAIQEVH